MSRKTPIEKAVEKPDDAPIGGREGFLTRWSRRKRETGTEEAGKSALAESAIPAIGPDQAAPEPDFDLSLLPDIETITAESDLSLFFRKGVPENLRHAALRRMWSADAAIRDYIGPVDYQWDFNDPAGVPGFGPLGADFDVEAMLRQVIGGADQRAEAANVPEAEQTDATKVEEAGPELARLPDAGVAETGFVQPEATPNPWAEDRVAAIEADAEAPAPLPRRHGGALPL